MKNLSFNDQPGILCPISLGVGGHTEIGHIYMYRVLFQLLTICCAVVWRGPVFDDPSMFL